MRRGVLVWGGAGLGVAALVGLGVYFARVGLDDADKLASVIGVFVALAGLGASAWGLLADRRSGGAAPMAPVVAEPGARPAPTRTYGGDHIEISGNVVHGDVIGKIDGASG
ncbi:hypothetical protein AB0L65_40290 [Nonomuraea sp. NPDC052116]|uniref:hypothetical protein n=1 Tax=Nonomuraea sp. NPDC052116 TaxID=3155665 RepID=UPI003416B11A